MAVTRGFNTASDVLSRTTDGTDLNKIWSDFISTIALVNKQRTAIGSLFTFDTTLAVDYVGQGSGLAEFEDASEFGAPKASRAGLEPLPMGFPLKWYDLAIRYTEAFLRDASTEQVMAQHNAALEANDRLIFNATLRALMTKTTIATRRTNESGASIYALWDGEVDAKPPVFAGQAFNAGHTHYLTSQSAQVDGADLRDLIRHITHHGYGTLPGEKIVILVHPNQGEAIRALRVATGSPFDFIPSDQAPAYLTTEQIVGDLPPAELNGLPIIGSFGGALIAENYYAVDGYVIAAAVAGQGSARNALAFRSHIRPEYQGLRVIPGTNNRYPLVESTYAQGFGVGVRNRGAAAVMQITTSATYTNPTL